MRQILIQLCEWKGNNNNRSRSMTRSYTYVNKNATKIQCDKCNEISKRKKQHNDIQKWGNMRYKYRNREFLCRGYCVDTVGKIPKI